MKKKERGFAAPLGPHKLEPISPLFRGPAAKGRRHGAARPHTATQGRPLPAMLIIVDLRLESASLPRWQHRPPLGPLPGRPDRPLPPWIRAFSNCESYSGYYRLTKRPSQHMYAGGAHCAPVALEVSACRRGRSGPESARSPGPTLGRDLPRPWC